MLVKMLWSGGPIPQRIVGGRVRPTVKLGIAYVTGFCCPTLPLDSWPWGLHQDCDTCRVWPPGVGGLKPHPQRWLEKQDVRSEEGSHAHGALLTRHMWIPWSLIKLASPLSDRITGVHASSTFLPFIIYIFCQE